MNFFSVFREGLRDDEALLLRLLVSILGVCIIILFSSVADASSVKDPVGDTFCKIIGIFRGNTARGVAVVGIIVLGVQTLRGKLQWEVSLVVVVGVIVLFKAPDIVDMISGEQASGKKCEQMGKPSPSA